MLTDSPDPGPERRAGDEAIRSLEQALAPIGLRMRGGFGLEPDRDRELLARFRNARTVAMIGNVGDELWRKSSAAILAGAGDHPLNTWIRDTLTPLAAQTGAGVLFDFEGPPWWPFQQWAQRAEPVSPSPLGLLIHPGYGLWHAYRAAFVFDRDLDFGPVVPSRSPCATCPDKPCLGACPVGAFDAGGYDVARCARHLFGPGEACRANGCLARLACPVGPEFRYANDQAQFHMDAFVASLRRRGAVG